MKNKSVQNCRFVYHTKFHCIMTTLNKLFKNVFERGGANWKRADKIYLHANFSQLLFHSIIHSTHPSCFDPSRATHKFALWSSVKAALATADRTDKVNLCPLADANSGDITNNIIVSQLRRRLSSTQSQHKPENDGDHKTQVIKLIKFGV